MEFLSMDIAIPPTDDEGYKYIFLMGDIFSKYVVAVPLKNQLAETISHAIWKNWISIHGCPVTSCPIKEPTLMVKRSLCEKVSIEKRHSSAYHSQGNGFAERGIRGIREILIADSYLG